MKVIINDVEKDIEVAQSSSLHEVLNKIESTLQQGHLVVELVLNDKVFKDDWYLNAENIVVLADDTLTVKTEDSAVLATNILVESKSNFNILLESFEKIADSFRMHDDNEANSLFIQGIENLQFFLKVLEEASFMLGRPLSKIKDGDVEYNKYIDELSGKLDKIITIQSQKDWIMLADMIEYEMLPALKNIGEIYRILEI